MAGKIIKNPSQEQPENEQPIQNPDAETEKRIQEAFERGFDKGFDKRGELASDNGFEENPE
ncbi:MAG: hypothetical protein M1381_11775 [Deltaproteobacteria bacterium]|nr:hypothetical protein [Deltaproteobacteria bacterium]